MANIEIPLSREDLGQHTLTANLAQIALLKTVLRHQKLQRLNARDVWQRVMRDFIDEDIFKVVI